jgi:enoyl-[acyl-carrier protein] reductase II
MAGNRVCDLLKIKYPMLQGGMTWVSEAVLASAVSNAGGLGTLAAGNMPGDLLREEIRKTRALTKESFAVNLIIMSPNFRECLEVVIEEKVPVITFGGGNSSPYISKLKDAGIKAVPVANSVVLGKRLERSGADAIIAEGQESGGHIGETSTLPLVPQMVDAVKIPVIAAGGIGDGRGMAAVFALGAEGVQLGTGLVVAEESRAHANYKKAIIESGDRDTSVTGRNINKPVRALKNMLTQEFRKLESMDAPWEDIENLAIGRLRKAVLEGDIIHGSVMMGEVAGLIKKGGTVKEILERMISEFNEASEKMNQLKVPAGGFKMG